jgi:O-antigen/teichoic acid export membrane protein
MASDPESLRQGFVEVISVILVFVLPVSVGVAVIAQPLVQVLLGEKWLGAVPIIQILALTGGIFAATSNNVSACFAVGKPQIAVLFPTLRLVLLIPLVLVLTREMGFVGAAYAELIAAVGSLVVSYPVLFRALRVSSRVYLASLWRPLSAALAMGLAVYALNHEVARAASAIAQLALGIPSGILVYFLALWILWVWSGKPRSAEAYLLDRAAELALRFRRTRQRAG